jgi:hypothetical protein
MEGRTMSDKRRESLLISIIGLFLILAVLPNVAYADSDQINYQGFLTDSSGAPVDGNKDMRFSIYQWHAELSDWVLAWGPEVHGSVPVNNGIFSVILGESISIQNIGGKSVLGVEVKYGTLYEPMVPTGGSPPPGLPLTSAPFAISAQNVVGYNVIDSWNVQDETILTSDIQNGTIQNDDISSSTAISASKIDATIARDSEIWPTVLTNDGPGSGLNADLLDGYHYNSFMFSSTDNWVNTSGDTMTGTLTFSSPSVDGISISTPGDDGIQISSPGNDGIYISNASDDGIQISGASYGLYATSCSTYGVHGANSSGPWGRLGTSTYGVEGYSSSNYGVYGHSNSSYGVIGVSETGTGVRGDAHSGGYGVYGTGDGSGWAGFFTQDSGTGGDVYVAGYLSVAGSIFKGGGGFKIDHPLDPENKYLSHSFVESPDMKNLYDGVVVLDENGKAWIELPEWFQALNKDFRYQLTPIGEPGPDLYIAQEISDNRFQVAGGSPEMKVSWQITGIRQDPYANEHRVPLEEEKSLKEQGYYLHPELYGQPQDKSMGGKRMRGKMLRMEKTEEEMSEPNS